MKTRLATLLALTLACGPSQPSATSPVAAINGATDPQTALDPGSSSVAVDIGRMTAAYGSWIEYANAGQWQKIRDLLADDVSLSPASSGLLLEGSDNVLSFFMSFATGFPDTKTYPLMVLTHSRTLAGISLARGTHTADMGPMKATGRTTSFLALTLIEFDNDYKMKRIVAYADNLNFMGQLGLWPGKAREVDTRTPDGFELLTAGTGAGEAANVALVRRWAERFNAHDAPGMLALYSPAAVVDDQHLAGPIATPKAIANWYSNFFPAFPDVTVSELELWAAGDRVLATYKLQGTNGGAYGRLQADRTMRQIHIEAAAVFRVSHGKISEQQVFADGMAMAIQLGVIKL